MDGRVLMLLCPYGVSLDRYHGVVHEHAESLIDGLTVPISDCWIVGRILLLVFLNNSENTRLSAS